MTIRKENDKYFISQKDEFGRTYYLFCNTELAQEIYEEDLKNEKREEVEQIIDEKIACYEAHKEEEKFNKFWQDYIDLHPQADLDEAREAYEALEFI